MKRLPLNDGTTGWRFSWGLIRIRKLNPANGHKSKWRWERTCGDTMTGYHFALVSVLVAHNAWPNRILYNFAGAR